MLFYNWFYPRAKFKRILSYYISLANIHNNFKEVKRILSIARRIGFTQNDINEIVLFSKNEKIEIPDEKEKRFKALYNFIKFISEINEDANELDLCVEMAIIVGYERYDAPTIAREIYHGLLLGVSEKNIKERIILIQKSQD